MGKSLIVDRQLNFPVFKDIVVSWAMGIGLVLILAFAIGITTIAIEKAIFAMI